MARTPVRRTATAALVAALAGVTVVAGVAPASAAPKTVKDRVVVVVDGGTLNGGTLNGGTLNGGTLNGGTLNGGTLN